MESCTKKGFQPLHLAAKYGQSGKHTQKTSKEFIVNAIDRFILTFPGTKVAELLLAKGAPVDAQGKNGVGFSTKDTK